jgi:peptide chain release factor subunit 1
MVEEGIFKLRKLLVELEQIKGRHTELVSVLIPSGGSVQDMMGQLRNEQGTAENIKSRTTRKNVVSALEKAIQHLKLYKGTPPNGLALYVGNIAEQEGAADIKVWAIEPPEKLQTKLYWCDQVFRLEPLHDMAAEKEIYGLVVMDNQEAAIGMLKGKKIVLIRHLESIVPSKTAKGGQSAQRFERVREGLINDFYKEIAESIKGAFPSEVQAILFGGPGPAKETFLREEYLPTDLRKQILGPVGTGYSDEAGLEELVERGKELLAEASVAKERELVRKFLEHLQRGTGLVMYKLKDVLDAMEKGAVDTLLLSEKSDLFEVEYECPEGHGNKLFVKQAEIDSLKCPVHGKVVKLVGKMDAHDAFEAMAKNYGTKLEIISKDTREGEQLLALGGLGAVLRYRLS